MNAPASQIIVRVESSLDGNPRAELDGRPVSLELAFERGFQILPADAPCVLSLIQRFVKTRDEFTK